MDQYQDFFDRKRIYNQKILLRLDLNVPLKEGVITDHSRITASLPSIVSLLRLAPKKLVIMSHLGRPKPGQTTLSLKPVQKYLEPLLGETIFLASSIMQAQASEQRIVLLENIRSFSGETENSFEFAQELASLGDLLVMDAFATIHRAHASTYQLAKQLPAIKGPLLTQELQAMDHVIESAQSPRLAIIGGAKISTKLTLMQSLIHKVDLLIPGGGIANTLLAAKGMEVGQSLIEPSLVPQAKDLLNQAQAKKVKLLLPIDAVVASSLNSTTSENVAIDAIPSDMAMFDIGPKTQALYKKHINQAQNILWNGPVGVFEAPLFSRGTTTLAQDIAKAEAYSLAGGGDTLAAIHQAKIKGIDYLSTGGGAMLAYCENPKQPGLIHLDN